MPVGRPYVATAMTQVNQAATADVTTPLIQVTQAAQVTQALRILEGTYQASNGWLTRFLRRKRHVIRRVTTSGRELPSDADATVEAFLRDCEEFMEMDFDLDTLLKFFLFEFFIIIFKPNSYHENFLCIFLINLINFRKFFIIFKLFFRLISPPGL